MSKKKTQEEFELELKEKFPQIEVVGKYTTARNKIEFHCKIHDHNFYRTPDHVLRSACGCPLCGREQSDLAMRKTKEQFVNEFNKVNDSVVLLGEYVTFAHRIKVQCKKCGRIWYARPDTLLRGNGCKDCAMKYVQNLKIKSNERFLADIKERNPNHDKFIVLTPYVKDEGYVTCMCLDCHRTWSVMAHNLVNKRSASACPYCCMSKGEAAIREFLDDKGIEFEAQKTFDDLVGTRGGLLRYDFYVPSHNLLIEYQGEFHDGNLRFQTEESLERCRIHDGIKKRYAEDNGFGLLEIWYQDKNKIPNILSERLLA